MMPSLRGLIWIKRMITDINWGSQSRVDANTIARIFPGLGDELNIKYSCCPN